MARTAEVLALAVALLLWCGPARAQTGPMPSTPPATFPAYQAPVAPAVSPPGYPPAPSAPSAPGFQPRAASALAPAPNPGLQPVRYQPKQEVNPRADTFPGLPEESLSITPPGPQQIFDHLDSEAELDERIRQKMADRDPSTRVVFPFEAELAAEPYRGRDWARRAIYAEPYYVIYDRLYFEDLNSERYGWDLGFIAPLVSTGIAIKDFLLFPMHAGTDPFRRHEANRGYCLSGDPVPYLLYPPEVSVTGAFLEAGAVVTLLAVFP